MPRYTTLLLRHTAPLTQGQVLSVNISVNTNHGGRMLQPSTFRPTTFKPLGKLKVVLQRS
jgi:hypothetical protein